MLSLHDKFNLLKDYKAIDYICFGKPVSEVAREKNIAKESLSSYITTKGAIISVVIEMTKLSQPKASSVVESLNEEAIVKEAKKAAATSIVAGIRVLKTKKARDYIKEQVLLDKSENVDVEKLINKKIAECVLSFAIDSLLIGTLVVEASSLKKINDWEGLVAENTYKVLRKDLVKIVRQIKSV